MVRISYFMVISIYRDCGFALSFQILRISIPWLPISVMVQLLHLCQVSKIINLMTECGRREKIWGGIVNDSRTWRMYVDGFISNLFAKNKVSETRIHAIKVDL